MISLIVVMLPSVLAYPIFYCMAVACLIRHGSATPCTLVYRYRLVVRNHLVYALVGVDDLGDLLPNRRVHRLKDVGSNDIEDESNEGRR